MPPDTLICGIDEVGRGSGAGPLMSVAALFRGWEVGVPGVNDSKKLSPARREKLFKMILWCPDLVDFGIGEVSVSEINKYGIDVANVASFSRAVDDLHTKPRYLVVDGLKGVPGWGTENMLVEPKADGTYPVVSAASILAKVIRDSYMTELSKDFPGYEWAKNKGYLAPPHCDGIRALGPTIHHRAKFIRKILKPTTGWS